MQQQEFLMVASVYAAMEAAAVAIAAATDRKNKNAWAQIVGHMLFPHKDPIEAGRYFADCINPNRKETLDPQELIWLMREAKRVGCHILHDFVCEESEYQKGLPVEAEDELADLQLKIDATARTFKEQIDRYERAAARIAKPNPLVR